MAEQFSIAVLFKLLDEMTAPLKKIESQFRNFGQKTKEMGQKFTQVGKEMTMGLTLPIMAMGGLSVKNFGEADAAAAKLENALKVTGKEGQISSKNLISYAEALQGSTNVEHEATEGAMALIAQMTNLNENQIKQIIPLIQDWSTAMDVDLGTATSQVTKVLTGSSNTLNRYKLGLDKNSDSTARFAAVTSFLQNRVEGTAGAMAKRGLGPLKSLKITFDELAEDIGSLLLPIVNDLAAGAKGLLNGFSQLDRGTKMLILTVAGILAAIGPLTAGIGGLITAFGTLSGVIGMVIGNPVVLGLIAVAAAITGIVLATNAWNNRFDDAIKNAEDMRKQGAGLVTEYQDLQKKTNKTAEEQKRMHEIQKQLIQSSPELAKYVNKLTGELDLGTRAAKEYNDELLRRENVAMDAKIEELNKKIKILDQEIDNPMQVMLTKEKMKEMRDELLFELKGLSVQKQQLNGQKDENKEKKKAIDLSKDLNDKMEEELGIKNQIMARGQYFVSHAQRSTADIANTMSKINSSVEVTVKVVADKGTEAVVDKVKKKGNAKTNVVTESYLGVYGFAGGAH